MDRQQLRFTTSADGTRLAYATFGAGTPLLVIQRWAMAVDVIWRHPEATAYYEKLAAFRRVVTFDRRGQGASERNITDLSMDRHVEDVLAVLSAAGIERCDVFGDGDAGAVAVELAARRPDLVSRLVLWEPGGLPAEPGHRSVSPDDIRAGWNLLRENWPLATQLITTMFFPTGPVEVMQKVARSWSRAMTPEMSDQYARFVAALDIRQACGQVTAPALVVHRRGSRVNSDNYARAFASLLPDAEYVEVPGDIGMPAYDGDETAAAMRSFLVADQPEIASGPSSTAIILFTDIAESTALTERMGDEAFRRASRSLDDAVRAAIRAAGGAPVEGKVLGDGVMGVFASAAQAIAAAQRCVDAASGAGMPLHIGVHAGDVIREPGNVYGGAVNIASRICGLCEPGEILVSQTVRDLARTSAGVTFEDRGEQALKGIAEPVRVFAVRSIR